ncbi:MAG: nicotinate phosphoribosyltransferase [Pseudomonadota bacterium]
METHEGRFALLTDLYELTMAAVYFERVMFEPATFSLFIRKYPGNRSYFVSAGLEDVLEYLQRLAFTDDDLEYLERAGLFKGKFLAYLENFRFSGDVRAIPEGRIFFKDEPILEVTAPIIEAQIVETFIINAINLQTMIATKASRCFQSAAGRSLVDFSLRRAQGIDAGLKAARASYIAGFAGTSNVLAGKIYGIPIFGTMAHSFVASFEDEIESFRAFAEVLPDNAILLIDTYDTLSGAHHAARVGAEMGARGGTLKGVRLDSGDMTTLSRKVRKIMQDNGLDDIAIVASGGLDEYEIADMIRGGADINSFGVGTKMGVSADAPYLDMAYKLVRYGRRPIMKLSTGKTTLVGEKQVFRFLETDGKLNHDIIGLKSEDFRDSEELLLPVMNKGELVRERISMPQIRKTFLEEFSLLDEQYKSIENSSIFPVIISPGLQQIQESVTKELTAKIAGEN